MASADRSRPNADEALHRHYRAVLLARREPADALLQPALRWRHREPRRLERLGRALALRGARDQRDRSPDDGGLRGGDDFLRRAPHRDRAPRGGPESSRAPSLRSREGPCEPAAPQGTGQDRRSVRQRNPDHRNPEGQRYGRRFLRALVRYPRQRPRRPAAASARQRVRERRASAALPAHRRRNPRLRGTSDPRRCAHNRGAHCLPEPDAELLRAGAGSGALRRQSSDGQGRPRTARRRSALRARRAHAAGESRSASRRCRRPFPAVSWSSTG